MDNEDSTSVLLNLEGLIKSHMRSIDTFEEEFKKHKEMLDDIFKNNPTYQDHLEKAKEAARIKSNTKKEILKQPQAGELNEKVKSLKSQIKETRDALSDYLREFQRMSGVNEIEGDDGQVREIVYVAKLVKRGALRG